MTSSARLALAAALLAASAAAADPYDFQIHKIGNPAGDADAHGNFQAFVRRLGAALTSVGLTPPETLGHSAFAVNAELSLVQLHQDDQNIFPTERLAFAEGSRQVVRPGVEGGLLIPSVHVRKGLPFSLELGARAAWIEKSRMTAGTAELKWAINEGFGYLPDVSLRGSVTKLFGTRDFDLTAGGADLAVGKEFAIGGMITLTPYVGWNLVWVGASSNTIDFKPDRPFEEGICGPDYPASCDRNAQISGPDTGVYDEVPLGDNSHNRFYAGVRFIGGIIQL
ncbi:MAG TPA: hypothetical protein VE549_14160, partial [Myxococcaceae bacterium]|nr:hypothetical protein [Myxococcaceae bacterium]